MIRRRIIYNKSGSGEESLLYKMRMVFGGPSNHDIFYGDFGVNGTPETNVISRIRNNSKLVYLYDDHIKGIGYKHWNGNSMPAWLKLPKFWWCCKKLQDGDIDYDYNLSSDGQYCFYVTDDEDTKNSLSALMWHEEGNYLISSTFFVNASSISNTDPIDVLHDYLKSTIGYSMGGFSQYQDIITSLNSLNDIWSNNYGNRTTMNGAPYDYGTFKIESFNTYRVMLVLYWLYYGDQSYLPYNAQASDNYNASNITIDTINCTENASCSFWGLYCWCADRIYEILDNNTIIYNDDNFLINPGSSEMAQIYCQIDEDINFGWTNWDFNNDELLPTNLDSYYNNDYNVFKPRIYRYGSAETNILARAIDYPEFSTGGSDRDRSYKGDNNFGNLVLGSDLNAFYFDKFCVSRLEYHGNLIDLDTV